MVPMDTGHVRTFSMSLSGTKLFSKYFLLPNFTLQENITKHMAGLCCSVNSNEYNLKITYVIRTNKLF